jgi:PAS domain S-box-containing protein
MPADAGAALEQLPLAVALIDAGGAVRYLNPAAEALYGWSAGEVVGKSALALGVAPSDTSAAVSLLSRLGAGETWTGRFPITRRDGTRVEAWLTVVAVPDADGGAEPSLLAVAADVLAFHLDAEPEPTRVAAEIRAEEANLLLEAMLHSVPVGMAFFDRGLRYVRVNAALAQINGIPPEAHVGRGLTDLRDGIPPDVADDIRRVFETGETIEQRAVSWSSPPGAGADPRHWMVSYYPVQRAGEVLWVGTTVVEVTEWRNAEAERAALLEAERSARQAAEQAAERLARLQIVTGRLAEASDFEAVAEVVVSHGSEGVGAAGGAMCVVEGGSLRVVRADGLAPAMVGRYGNVALDADVPLADAVRRGEVILLRSLDERDREYPSMAGAEALNRSFAAVPMLVEGRAVGCIVFGWADEREFTEGEPGFLLALGRQAAQAIERSRLYAAERSARAEAEQAWERMRFLADASRVLSSSLDYEVTLADLTRLVVSEVADSCMVHLLDDHDDDLRLVAVSHVNAADEKRLGSLADEGGRGRQPVLLGRVLVTGEALLLTTIPDSLWQQLAQDDGQLAELRSLRFESAVVVPLRVQGKVVGVLSLGSTSAERRYERDDLPFVEDLAARTAVAIENSRSHKARTEVAQTLQRSLLPPHLPKIPGLELAQRYHSMGALEVGGDFFDVFPAGDGRWGVVMGDVCGKGVGAASLTALARYTVRAGAIDEADASQVLRLLNRAILDSDADERFCTIVYATVEPLAVEGGARVILACGGHPLPLLLAADGSVRAVGEPGTAIGLFEEVDLREVDVALRPGDSLVLFTDGFVEVRSPSGDFDPDLLARVLATAAGRTAEGIAEIIDAAAHDFEGGRQRDDMALLILRAPSA